MEEGEEEEEEDCKKEKWLGKKISPFLVLGKKGILSLFREKMSEIYTYIAFPLFKPVIFWPSLLAPLKMTYVTKSDLHLDTSPGFSKGKRCMVSYVYTGVGVGGDGHKSTSPSWKKKSLAYSESLIS